MPISLVNQLPTIAAAIIVKNAENGIAKTIKSVENFCEQIIVIDTGSTDRTPIICSQLGAEIHFFDWIGDFSAARNYALRFARTDWVLTIDSDEEFISDSLEANINLFFNPEIGGIRVMIENLLSADDDTNFAIHNYPRIYRNHKDIKFTGKIHEQISDSILAAHYSIADSNIKIRHFGYLSVESEKIERNRQILEDVQRAGEKDDWLLYHSAITEFAADNIGVARDLFLEIVNSSDLAEEQIEISKLRLSQIALRNDDYEELDKWSNFVSNDSNREGLRKYILGTAELLKNNFNYAISYYNANETLTSCLVDKTQLEKAIEICKTIAKTKPKI